MCRPLPLSLAEVAQGVVSPVAQLVKIGQECFVNDFAVDAFRDGEQYLRGRRQLDQVGTIGSLAVQGRMPRLPTGGGVHSTRWPIPWV
jgi:hypothetical protein